MRIAYLSGAYIPSRGANSMHVMAMCEAMAQLGHDVTLYARPGDLAANTDFEFYGVDPVFTLSKQSRPQLKAWGALVYGLHTRKAVTKGKRPDLIYARETWALSLVADQGIPFVFESHWRPRSLLHRIAEARLLRHPLLVRVVFISDALRQIYADLYPWLNPQKMQVAHDAAKEISPIQQPGSIRPRTSTGLQIGYVGSFQPGSGIELIATIAALLPDADFHIFGGSPDDISGWSNRTSAIGNIKFHGFIPPNQLPAVYEALDLVLAPYQESTRSIEWASPMKLFEYMAFGKAIVCSDFPVFREVLEHGVTGIFVASDRADKWAQAIGALRDNESMRQEIGSAGKKLLGQHFTWRKRAHRVLDGIVVSSAS